MSNNKTNWSYIEEYIDDKLSIVPAGDDKSPVIKWQDYQVKRMDRDEFWKISESKETNNVAIICGGISGGLEVIDIDSKHKEGISSVLFKEIKTLFPDLFDKLRIHKTPSGGYHILYRIIDKNPENNMKLASRPKTDEEIKQERNKGRKRISRSVCFLETRGEGGLIIAPPSIGYSVIQDLPIPNLLWSERCDLINVCRSFNEITDEEIKYKKREKSESKYYEITPWDDYNDKADYISLVEKYGWTRVGHVKENTYFSRPNSRSKDVHASMKMSEKWFYIFTTNDTLEEGRAYSPASFLLEMEFGGDVDKWMQYLRDNGFGKLNYEAERSLVLNAINTGRELPKNISEKAVKKFQDLKTKYDENMPFGKFWSRDLVNPNKIKISRDDLYRVSDELGFKIYKEDLSLVRINGNVIDIVDPNYYFDTISEYVWEATEESISQIRDELEKFFQNSGKYTISRLRHIGKDNIVRDGRYHAYKFFQNGYVYIDKNRIQFKGYETLKENSLVWGHKVQQRDWVDNPESKDSVYIEFLNNAIDVNNYSKSIIGYLSHDYKDEDQGYIIVMVEQTANPDEGGGSGKNIFGNMFKHSTSIRTVPASMIGFDDKFFAAWNGERIYFLADLPRRIDWGFLKEIADGEGYINKKYIGEYTVQSSDMPKLLMNTNYGFSEPDGGVKRRIRQLEFKPYYTIHGGVSTVHNKLFPTDFSNQDWIGFDWFITECIQNFFKNECKIQKESLSEIAWEKMFKMEYTDTAYEFIEANIEHWKFKGFVPNTEFRDAYIDICREYDIPDKYRLSANKLNQAVVKYCEKFDYYVDISKVVKVNGMSTRGKEFSKDYNIDPPF